MSPADRSTSEQHAVFVKTLKALAMDAVQAANAGHPGMPMGAADMAAVLYLRFLRHDPSCPGWPNRDRFVLSAGHGSMLLYSLLHLTGYDLPLSELQRFRQLGSKTPGHPEVHETAGVEVTTGPLGTGFAAGVGMAIAERILADRFNRPDHRIIDHYTYGIVSDGDLMEGIASEAASLAGHLGLHKLVYLYDDNKVTIDGSTSLSFSEDVGARFLAYGWHIERVDGHDPTAIARAIATAQAQSDRPSLILCRTVIAHGSPNMAGHHDTHGAPLGQAEVDATKAAMNWPLEPKFHVPKQLLQELAAQGEHLKARRQAWDKDFEHYRREHPELAAELSAMLSGELPGDLFAAMPEFSPGTQVATRKASNKILEILADRLPGLVGGSADLAGSNGVDLPAVPAQSREQPGGRKLHFGVREHAMAGIANGLALHGGIRPYTATFLIFSDFMRGALRLSALMQLPVVHVFSHDSFWLGEDGPTHQPIEHTMSLRMIPGLHAVRPADAKETIGAWRHALARRTGPTAILLTRQNLPVLAESQADVSRGAYVLWQPDGASVDQLHGILLATGSEVSLALAAAKRLQEGGKALRVVSMPCWEAFAAQDPAYREAVLPASLQRRLSLEAGTTFGWERWAKAQHGIDRFGASAPGAALAELFGFQVDQVVEHYLSLA